MISHGFEQADLAVPNRSSGSEIETQCKSRHAASLAEAIGYCSRRDRPIVRSSAVSRGHYPPVREREDATWPSVSFTHLQQCAAPARIMEGDKKSRGAERPSRWRRATPRQRNNRRGKFSVNSIAPHAHSKT